MLTSIDISANTAQKNVSDMTSARFVLHILLLRFFKNTKLSHIAPWIQECVLSCTFSDLIILRLRKTDADKHY